MEEDRQILTLLRPMAQVLAIPTFRSLIRLIEAFPLVFRNSVIRRMSGNVNNFDDNREEL